MDDAHSTTSTGSRTEKRIGTCKRFSTEDLVEFHQTGRRPARGRARTDRVMRTTPDLRQSRTAGKGRRQVARPSGQFHGGGRRSAGVPAPRRAKGLDTSDDYHKEKMPAVNVS